MRSGLSRSLAVIAIIMATTPTGFSAPPQLVNYQGEVTDGGLPVANGNYAMEFRVFATSAGGVALWSEAVANVPVSNGRFNVLLGQVTALPENIFDGTERWLESVFNGEILIPRVRFVTVAYAHRISTVDGATGGDISGEVSIAAAATGAALGVTNTTGGAWAGRFETTPLNSSEPTLLSVGNGNAAAIAAHHPWGGVGIQSSGDVLVMDSDFQQRLQLDPYGANGSGQLNILQSDGTKTVELVGTPAVGAHGGINLYKGVVNTVAISGGNSTQGGEIVMYDDQGDANVFIDGETSAGGGRLTIYNGADATVGGAISGYMQIGSVVGPNLLVDNNELLARDGLGSYSELHLQADGGSVLIGGNGLVAPAGYIFAVDGKAIMEEVEVSLSVDWPDYVFEPGYELMPLDQLARHVREKKHLPGIPSETSMKDARLPLGEMQTKLLEKVEELTLYVLQLSQELDEAQRTNKSLQTRLESLETTRK